MCFLLIKEGGHSCVPSCTIWFCLQGQFGSQYRAQGRHDFMEWRSPRIEPLIPKSESGKSTPQKLCLMINYFSDTIFILPGIEVKTVGQASGVQSQSPLSGFLLIIRLRQEDFLRACYHTDIASIRLYSDRGTEQVTFLPTAMLTSWWMNDKTPQRMSSPDTCNHKLQAQPIGFLD